MKSADNLFDKHRALAANVPLSTDVGIQVVQAAILFSASAGSGLSYGLDWLSV